MSDKTNRTTALLALIVFALAGVADGIYLTLVHLDYETGNAEAATVCHKLAEHGCTITAGKYGALLGIPVATIGFAGATTVLLLAIMAWLKRNEAEDANRSLVLVMSAIAVGASVLMGGISMMEGSFCPFCVIWYGINAATFAAAYFARNRNYGWGDLIDDCLGSRGFVAVAVFSVVLLGGAFWHHGKRADLMQEREDEMMKHAPEIAKKICDELMAKPVKPFDASRLPSKGPDDAEVKIIEFGDFECPHCKKGWEVLETYYEQTDRKVQLRFGNFPLDSKCNPNMDREIHPHACEAAAAGHCADQQGKFWEYGSKMFDNQGSLGHDDLLGYAKELGLDVGAFTSCLDSEETASFIKEDIVLGDRLDIRATPTSYVNDVEMTGALPPPLFAAVVDELLARQAKDSGQSGQ